MTPRPTASPRYRALARRYAQLVAIVQPSAAERAEMYAISVEMAEIEMTLAVPAIGAGQATGQSGALA